MTETIKEETTTQSNDTSKESIQKVSINKVKANKEQPRKYFDQEKIEALAQSIQEHGIIQPIVVQRDGENFKVIAGERRWRAAKLIGLEEVPIVVMDDLEGSKVLELSLIENIQREDLNPVEEGEALRKLLDDFNLTQQELSAKIGKSRTAITNSMRLLNLNDDVKQYLIEKIISEGHGRALLGLKDSSMQLQLAQKVIDEDLSVRQCEQLVKKLNSAGNDEEKVEEVKEDIFYKDIKYRLEEFFGTKVNLKTKNKDKGKIEIEYYSEDELNRIIEMLEV